MAQIAAHVLSHDDEFKRRIGKVLRSGPVPVSVIDEIRDAFTYVASGQKIGNVILTLD